MESGIDHETEADEPPGESPPGDELEHAMAKGPLSVEGRLVNASNLTLFATVSTSHGPLAVVYKPLAGIRALHDFAPETLPAREVSAYALSRLLGWDLVPPTVPREHGPAGPGCVQAFVDHDPRRHGLALLEEARFQAHLTRVALFDLLVNNADRKASHLLLDADDRVWGVDHGLTFHVEDKVRTILWQLGPQPVPGAWRRQLRALADALDSHDATATGALGALSPAERRATAERAAVLAQREVLPEPPVDRRAYPWPLL